CATSRQTSASSRASVRSQNQPARAAASSLQTRRNNSCARRVLPTPAGPTTVTTHPASLATCAVSAARSASRPTNASSGSNVGRCPPIARGTIAPLPRQRVAISELHAEDHAHGLRRAQREAGERGAAQLEVRRAERAERQEDAVLRQRVE